MPKVPFKPVANTVMPVKKKVAKKPEPPKVVFKKGVTDIVEILAIAADLEGMWPRDLVRFPDLKSKYGFPEKISDSIVTRAKLRHREHIRDLYVKHGPKKDEPKPSVKKVAVKKKLPIPDKSIAVKKKTAKTQAVVTKKAAPTIGTVMGPISKPHQSVGKVVKMVKTPQKRG